MAYIKLISFLLLFYCCSFLKAQTPLRFEHFGVEEGLSQNVVHCIFQDSRGFLWIGTHNGLNLYDGYEFRKFYHNPFDKNSLENNTILAIQEDSIKNIWLLTYGYLSSFDPKTETFKNYKLPVLPPPASAKGRDQMISAAGEHLLLRFSSAIFLFDCKKNFFQPVSFENISIEQEALWNKQLFKTPEGHILISAPGNKNGFYCYDAVRKTFISRLPSECTNVSTNQVFSSSYMDARHNIYAFDTTRRLHILPRNNSEQLIDLSKLSSTKDDLVNISFAADNAGNTWMATAAGLIKYNYFKKDLQLEKHIDSLPYSLTSNILTCIYIDKTNNLWTGTYGAGLNKYTIRRPAFTSFTTGMSTLNSLSGKFVFGIREAEDSSVYVSFYDSPGFSIINKERSIVTDHAPAYIKNPVVFDNLYPEFSEQKLPGELRTALVVGKIRSLNSSILFIDNKKNTWKKETDCLVRLSDKRKFIINAFINTYLEDEKNNFWIGTNDRGIYYVNTTSGNIQNFRNMPQDIHSISGNNINAIVKDADAKTLWLGTEYGLNSFDISSHKATFFTTENGLCNNTIYAMASDDSGFLWLGTGNGLSRFNMQTHSFTNYDKKDGLINNEYNRNAAVKTKSGELIFGGTEGVDIINPASLFYNAPPAIVEISGFRVFNKNRPFNNPVKLAYTENNITIGFAAMDFTNPGRNKYAYKLEPADKNGTWKEGAKSVTYSALPPGNYSFKVKAANADGIWSASSAILSFTISPPWFKTWWFYLLCIFFIVTGVYFLFSYRYKQQLKLMQLRNRIHRDLHDDIGASLSTVKVYADMLQEQPAKKEFINLISENANDMLEKLEVIAWSGNPQQDRGLNLLNKMKEYCAALFHNKGIDIDFTTNHGFETLILPGAVRQHFFLIFTEAVTNIIKYAACSSCVIILQKKSRNIEFIIKDNGQGFDTSSIKRGNGLANMQYRAKEVGGNCVINAAHGKGTAIFIKIPYPFKMVFKN